MNFLVNLLIFVDYILQIYMIVVIAAALITWVQPNPNNPIVRFLFQATEPVYARIRRIIPTNFGGFDIAPMILIFGIIFIQRVGIVSLIQMLNG